MDISFRRNLTSNVGKQTLVWAPLLLIALAWCADIQSGIKVRKADEADLPALLTMDREVTDEYFVPLYRAGYPDLCIGENPELYLYQELEDDATWFAECVNAQSKYLLYIAVDQDSNEVAGLIISHKTDEETLLLDLLLVRKQYRKMGVGKILVRLSIEGFGDIKTCVVCPFGCEANRSTLNFYQAMGFKDLGPSTIDECVYGIPYKELYRQLELKL